MTSYSVSVSVLGMLDGIVLTLTTKLNVAFVGLMNYKSRKYCRPANAIEQK